MANKVGYIKALVVDGDLNKPIKKYDIVEVRYTHRYSYEFTEMRFVCGRIIDIKDDEIELDVSVEFRSSSMKIKLYEIVDMCIKYADDLSKLKGE